MHFKHERAKDAHAPGYYLHIGPHPFADDLRRAAAPLMQFLCEALALPY
jgi:hypothetical protein